MNTDNRNHRRKAAYFLHAITDDDFEKLGEILISLYQKDAVSKDIIIEILHVFAGMLETEPVWKVLIANNPDSEDLRKDCIEHFFGTGMTSGLDGVARAYDSRYKMFTRWQSDRKRSIKQVGNEGANAFKAAAKKERERVQEEQRLREYHFKNNEY